jgi:cytochrome c-type biogenesis protein CcmH/NrfF
VVRVSGGLAVAGLVGALLILGVGSAMGRDGGAIEPAARGWAYELHNHLMSPFCPGRTLADCSSPQAASLRMWIVVQEATGRSRADVEDELLERYGDVLRPAPLATGFGITAYAVPVLAFLCGGVGIAVFLRRQTRAPKGEGATSEARPADPELERIIDEQLAR